MTSLLAKEYMRRMFKVMAVLCTLLVAAYIKIRRWVSLGPDSVEALSLLDATLEEIADGLDRKAFTSTQLVQAYKARITKVNNVFPLLSS
ncbi:hypothetical protein B0O99DRAFT_681904 [Bisporella sp. PMI_857]|nr:hypothetical protein B0O99DRAFT_681904 [Bisporella sp. PMI_857]